MGTRDGEEKNYSAWKLARETLLIKASHPSMSVRTVTTLVRAAPAEASATESTTTAAEGRAWSRPEITVETLELGDHDRPKGRRFGALVHALLASIDLDAGLDAIKSAQLLMDDS